MAQVFTLRMLSGEDDGFMRDLAVRDDQTLLRLHEAIQRDLGFDPGLMSSFFTTDDSWSKGEEIPLINMTGEEGARTMENTRVGDVVHGKGDRLLYLFDYLSNRGFFIEVVAVAPPEADKQYPYTVRAAGDPPPQLLLDDLHDAGTEPFLPDDDEDLLADGFEDLDDLPI